MQLRLESSTTTSKEEPVQRESHVTCPWQDKDKGLGQARQNADTAARYKYNTRQNKTRQDKTRQGKTRQDKRRLTIELFPYTAVFSVRKDMQFIFALQNVCQKCFMKLKV
jgi:hypothetical protein